MTSKTNQFFFVALASIIAMSATLGFNIQEVYAENTVVVNVSGTFGEESDLIGNLPIEDFPFPELYGGSFDGSFSYDSDAIPVGGFAIDYQSVNVDIFDNTGALIHTIDSGPNQFKVFDNFAIASMGESAGPDAINMPENLRLWYDGAFVGGISPSASVMNDATPNAAQSFIEVDGIDSFTYWDLPLISFTSIVDVGDEKKSCEALEKAESKGNGKHKGIPKAKENNGCN